MNEKPITFECQQERLVGIAHIPENGHDMGVVIIVGGPQYRVGSHRQFVLLARYLATNGFAVFRFDYRGMGDSSGELHTFEQVSEDIRQAINVFQKECPQVKKIALWGLCDAASAALFYGHTDPRVRSLILLNPWVRTESGQAKAYIKSYYLDRILDVGFWKKLLTGKVHIFKSISSYFSMLKLAYTKDNKSDTSFMDLTLPERMLTCLKKFTGKILFILSGQDLTAEEFRNLASDSPAWNSALADKNISTQTLEEADHTFSTAEWRHQVEIWTKEWLGK
jgi:exosortase A-associated hydrolase 1